MMSGADQPRLLEEKLPGVPHPLVMPVQGALALAANCPVVLDRAAPRVADKFLPSTGPFPIKTLQMLTIMLESIFCREKLLNI